MIVISEALQLAQTSEPDADYPVLGWHNLVTRANIAADSELADYPATNLANPSTVARQGWRSDSLSVQYVTVSPSIDEDINYAAVARHNFGSAEIAVAVEGLTAQDGAEWQEIVEERFLGNDEPAIFRFDPSGYIGLRLKLTPNAVKPKAAVLYVGRLLVFEMGVQPGEAPITYARERNVVNGRTQGGDFVGRIVNGGSRKTGVTINLLSADWYRETLDPFMEASAEVPFFWAWRPQTYPREVGYAWLTADPRPNPAHLAGYINVQLQMEGIL